MWTALAIFLFSYLIIAGQKLPFVRLDRPAGALLGAVGMVVFGVVTPAEAGRDAVDHDTILLLLGMMIVTAYMAEARLFRYVSWLALTRLNAPRRLLVGTVFVSGGLSAALVNDTVCLMLTPLIVQLARDAKLRPLPFLLALAFGSNAGSLATPTGNPQNMIIATLSGVDYARFAGALALPALVSLLVVVVLLMAFFRRDLPSGTFPPLRTPPPEVQPRLAVLCLVVLSGVIVAFFAGASLAWTALTGAAALVFFGRRPPRRVLEQVDWVLLLFFGGLFIVVHGMAKAGLAEAMFVHLRPVLGTDPLTQATVFGAFTVVASQIVSNVPFVLLAAHWMPEFADPTFMWLSTALFATLAGNLTLVGSMANLIVLEGAGERHRIGFIEFLKYGSLVASLTIVAGFGVLWVERLLGWI